MKAQYKFTIRKCRYLLKVMQQVEEDNGKEIGSSVAYFNSQIWSSTTIINLDDYCRLFETRSQLSVYLYIIVPFFRILLIVD